MIAVATNRLFMIEVTHYSTYLLTTSVARCIRFDAVLPFKSLTPPHPKRNKGRAVKEVPKMKLKLTIQGIVWVALAAVAMLSLTTPAGAIQGEKKIRLLDDCEPVSFTAVFGEGICTGDGKTTAQEFLAELEATQDAHKWRNQPSNMLLNVGRPTLIENRG